MIGTRGHDVGGLMSAAELAEQMQQQGYGSVQLVVYKSITGVSDRAGSLSPGQAFAIGQPFRQRGIHIGLIGSYFNLLDETDGQLSNGIARFEEYLCYARELGGHLVGTETGSYLKDWGYHPDNHGEAAYQKVLAVFRRLAATAEKYGSLVAIEGAWPHCIYSPQRMKRLLDDLDSANVVSILDPVNFLNEDNYLRCNDTVQQAFELYGERIALIQAKDVVFEQGALKRVAVGDGIIDYDFIKAQINRYKPGIDIIIEEQAGEGLHRSKVFLTRLMEQP